MLKTIDVLKDVEEKYHPMLRMVNIPDLYKCLACFSGLYMESICDETVKKYLTIWAKNKYKFFKMFGSKLRIDSPFQYTKDDDDFKDEFMSVAIKYPMWAPWIDAFRCFKKNKINGLWDIGLNINLISRLFPSTNLSGTSITHFFKKYLNMPDDIVTEIAAIFENSVIQATHTVSIDPVDMMLASENPYNWTSCYRLETGREDSHADGCVAAMLDNSSIITYVWNEEGKFKLYNKYVFKNIRYKRIRQYVAISEHFSSIHFNTLYPGKDRYGEKMQKDLRDKVETLVANYFKRENKWKKDYNHSTYRKFDYGYNEFSSHNLWSLSDSFGEDIAVYDERVPCLCGCSEILLGSDECVNEAYEYNGEGFICDNFYQRYYCDLADDYCENDIECCEECNCSGCWHWVAAHPRCGVDRTTICRNCAPYDIDEDGYVEAGAELCRNCPIMKGEEND